MIHDITSYIYLLIYILLWFFVCYNHYKKAKFSSGLVVILSYLVYGILSFILYSDNYLGRSYGELNLFPFIYLFIMLYMFLSPVFKYERFDVKRLFMPNYLIIRVFLLIYSVSAIVILPNTLTSLSEGLRSLLLDSSGGLELYNESSANYVVRRSGVSGIYGLIAIVYNTFSDVAKFIFFYYLTLKNKKKVFVFLFFLFFIVDILYPLSRGGRTGVIMNFFSLFMALTLFYPFYSSGMKKKIKKVVAVLILSVTIPFMILTISRFSETDSGVLKGMLYYSGQSSLNFNTMVLNAGGIRNGDRTINLFKQFIFNDTPKDFIEVRLKYPNLKINDGLFSTYVGDFVLDYGPLGAFIIFLFLFFWFNRLIYIFNKTIPFHSLFLIYFILCISMQGGMYLFNYSFMGNIKIIGFVFMYLILYIDFKSRKTSEYLSLKK